jgi:hypothetical protein
MITFDLAFETYVRNLITNSFLPYSNVFYYINNLKPEYIDKEEDKEKYLVIFDEGELSRIHRDFVESGTKAYFLNFLTPVIENKNSLKLFKQQLDDIAENLRFENTIIEDAEGVPIFSITSSIGDSDPIEKVTQNGIRYLFRIDVSCVYNSLQEEEGKVRPVREEERKLEISLDSGKTFQEVKGKISFQKSLSSDLNIYPTNNQPIAQHYLKQRRKTCTLQVQRATTGVAEEMYQLYEDNSSMLQNVRIRCKDYEKSPTREYYCSLIQAVESGEYSLFTSLVFSFEIRESYRLSFAEEIG